MNWKFIFLFADSAPFDPPQIGINQPSQKTQHVSRYESAKFELQIAVNPQKKSLLKKIYKKS